MKTIRTDTRYRKTPVSKQTRRILSILLALTLCLGMFPASAFAAENQEPTANKTRTGISTLWDNDLQDLGFTTDSKELVEQAKDPDSPYGNGNTALITWHELLTQGANSGGDSILYEYASSDFRKNPAKRDNIYDDVIKDAIAARSVAFDPFGSGKQHYVATIYAEPNRNETSTDIFLWIGPNASHNSTTPDYRQHLVTLPFLLYPENAGAYLSITAGNFDGDKDNTEEIALYHPYYSTKKDKALKSHYGSGTIDVYSFYSEADLSSLVLKYKYGLKRLACYELIDQSKWYFFDNSALTYITEDSSKKYIGDWKLQYFIPQVGVETVKQPGSAADDLCITFTAAMGGQKNKDFALKSRRPYDSATGVFFWIDPATKKDKNTSTNYMRWQWKDKYSVPEDLDKKAKDKYEVMAFGGAGAGDVNGDGYQEVVVAGYRFKKADQVWDGGDNGDWDFAEDEYLATYFTYDPDKNTYKHTGDPANWVAASEDYYAGAYDQLDGMYHNIGEKDSVHNPLAVACFADRGTGYAEAAAIGGIITYLDDKSGVSTYLPDDKKFAGSMFESGAFNGLYAIPTKGIRETTFGKSVQNRTFVDLVAGNFDGNLLGKEYLAFAYTAKRDGKDRYYSAFGVIGQQEVGEIAGDMNIKRKGDGNWDEKHYINKKIISFELYTNASGDGRWRAPIAISAVDYDNDSYIMRRANRPNEYFFSDPEIIAVLQGAPYFKDVDYGANNGNTTFKTTQGSSVDETHGVYAGVTVQAGFTHGVAAGPATWSKEFTSVIGAALELRNSWGDGDAKYYSLSFESAEEDCVALVMAPCVRYHYDVYDPKTKRWDPIEVDVGQTPRASIITVESYDEVAKDQGWELIRGNILPDNDNDPNTPYIYGDPTAYYQNPTDLRQKAVYDPNDDDESYFYGATTKNYGSTSKKNAKNYGADDYVKLGVSNGSSITQSITTEKTESTIREWSTGVHGDIEFKVSHFAMNIEAAVGYTGSKTWIDFAGTEFAGKVTSVPVGYEDYSFAWRFGYWNDSLKTMKDENGKAIEQTFPVLGYLVKDIQQPVPEVEDPKLHVYQPGAEALTLSWMPNAGAVDKYFYNHGYVLYRMDQDVWYPMYMAGLGNVAENGLMTYTDHYVDPYSKYQYALRPYAIINGSTRYGDYMSHLEGHTLSDLDNQPRAIVTVTDKTSKDQTLTAIITPATEGDVGPVSARWQQYVPKKGGWQNLESSGPTLTISAKADPNDYRCQVSQRVENKIYTVYSGTQKSGYVFVAGKSRQYTDAAGKKVVDYTLVHEDGTVSIIASTDTTYQVRNVYLMQTDSKQVVTLTTDENTRQNTSVISVATREARFSGGETLALTGITRIWDVAALTKALSSNTSPLLQGTTDMTAVIEKLPAVTARDLKTDDRSAHAVSEEDILQTAFVHGTVQRSYGGGGSSYDPLAAAIAEFEALMAKGEELWTEAESNRAIELNGYILAQKPDYFDQEPEPEPEPDTGEPNTDPDPTAV